ncbi:MAG TPA: PIN domain-containing protein [Deltaproteobacteria bacterium]|nr:PIN domain-containing protein [Deltaproteobacteria bacterium]
MMMSRFILMRLLLVIFASFSGYFILRQIVGDHEIAFTGFVGGIMIALVALRFEEKINDASLKTVVGGAIGLIIGLVVANLLSYPLVMHFLDNPYLEISTYLFMNCVMGYLGLSIGMKKADEFDTEWLAGIQAQHKEKEEEELKKPSKMVVDTSVIIDGRLSDICETGFIEGTLIIPHFVLEELQHLADSHDPLKKAKGTRGLDILERLQRERDIDIVISDEDFTHIKQVDMKLVALARRHNAKLLTNDINLNKMAKLHRVPVLSINALANALKPAILPGETIHIYVLKEGKEDKQGVGYLDDGTMVVIDEGCDHVGKTIDVVVTSILQTSTGRMIFSKVKEGKKSDNVVSVIS